MTRTRAGALSLAAASLLGLIALGGCAAQPTTTGTGTGSAPTTGTPPMRLELVEQWAESGHARPITFAATQDGCKNCHDGLTFTTTGGGFQPRIVTSGATESVGATGSLDGTAGAPPRDWVVATDCRVCHTAAGVDIAGRGTIDGIPNVETAEGGRGALCMACHNGWHQPGKQSGQLNAPHRSVQGDMFLGVNTVEIAGAESTATAAQDTASPHAKVPDTCVGCHVSGAEGADTNHLFVIEDFSGCEREECHDSDMTDGGDAKEDFDGDGSTEKFTAEVEGLKEILKDVLDQKAGGEVTSGQGQVRFPAGFTPDDATYNAAYNYFFVDFDRSRGIHNPKFAVLTLTNAITSLGGTVGRRPGAESTGTGEATGTP